MDRIFARYLLLASLVALPGMINLMAQFFWPGPDLLEQRGYYIGLDFVNYWTGGRLALTGQVDTLYDIAAYNELLRTWFAPAEQFMVFSYPPNALPLLAPFGALPYLVALPVWLGLGTIAFYAVCLGAWPKREDVPLLFIIAISPVLCVNLNFGQLGLFLAFAFVGALRVLPTRPVLAGVMIGLLTIKPQLGVLLALTLVATGAWRAFAAATLTALLLMALSVGLYGVEPWLAWWGETAKIQLAYLSDTQSFFVTQMTTPFSAARRLGVNYEAALTVQIVIALGVIAVTWRVLKSEAAWSLKAAVVAFGSVLIPPYVLAYDLAIPLAALVWCLRDDAVRPGLAPAAAVALVWAIPFALTILLQARGIPVAPLAVLICYVWLVREAMGVTWSSLVPATPSSRS